MQFIDLDTELDRLEADRDFSGSVLITQAGRTVYEAHRGLADRAWGAPIGPGTRFALGSVTKIFTAAVILDLVDEGRLGLDTAVASVLPPERRPSTLRDDVTVRHLLTHTSGIADYFEEETATDDWAEEFAALWRDRPVYRVLTPADYLPLFADLPPYRAPGGRFQYSNAGFILLGLVIEDVAGTDYFTAVDERVFSRAGMDESGFFRTDEVRPDVAAGYLRPTAPGLPWRTNVFSTPAIGAPDGGAFSSAPDLDRFLTAYAAGELVKPDLLEQALSPHIHIGKITSMGLGVYLFGDDDKRAFGADGGDPGAEALIRRYPVLDVNTVVLSNVNDSAWTVDEAVRKAVKR
ncbi:serine hydrolase domain-containing protein [Glycomyces artemisiae]|uniref:CubicO group peptidase (Beta-lactamase class C family) n=1 Tax=Glycomyces artemisiae TaxID=1076443 RepID=A0A2T0UE46_9ACTN|nr:serine hydrolase domain-containing protein [Glycomyces artemisiae]PRY56154.1 CubicO group peptidase (beta-lactamase class C family) [Glycomyces artemisiae]